MDIGQSLSFSAKRFKEANLPSAALDGRLLLSYVLSKPVEYLLLNFDRILSPLEQERFLKLVETRSSHKPMAYILGYKEFYGRIFKLNDKVLIPRPDTETLVDAVLTQLTIPDPQILELGCGSGCLIISLLLEINEAQGVACDIDEDAISIMQENALVHKVDDRLEVTQSNWFNNIKNRKFDIIVCNPPYISEHEKPLMSQETVLYEPHLALFAIDNGLEAYKIIASQAATYLNYKGELFLEVGFDQMEAVKEIFTSCGFNFKTAHKDLGGHYRVANFTLCDLKTIDI